MTTCPKCNQTVPYWKLLLDGPGFPLSCGYCKSYLAIDGNPWYRDLVFILLPWILIWSLRPAPWLRSLLSALSFLALIKHHLDLRDAKLKVREDGP